MSRLVKPTRAWDRLLALPEPERSWRIERSCMYIFEAGMPVDAADEKALADPPLPPEWGGRSVQRTMEVR